MLWELDGLNYLGTLMKIFEFAVQLINLQFKAVLRKGNVLELARNSFE